MTVRAWLAAIAALAGLPADEAQRIEAMLAGRPAMGALLDAARLIGLAGEADRVFGLALSPAGADARSQTVALVMACFAIVRFDFPARPDAIDARTRLSALADAAYGSLDTDAPRTLGMCIEMAGAALDHVSAVAVTLAPIVRVETGLPLPSSLLAFDLYGDAARGDELVARNRHHAPLLMPTVFEAVAP